MAVVAVLGGGFGGLTAAYELQNYLIEAKLTNEHQVVLVTDRPYFTFRPALPWLVFGRRRPKDVCFDLTRACRKRGISLIVDHVAALDTKRHAVSLGSGVLFYDHAVFALGSEPDPDAVPGLLANSHSPIWLEEALILRDALRRYRGGPIVAGIPTRTVRWPTAGYEMLWFLADWLDRAGLGRKAKVHFVTAERRFLSFLPPRRAAGLAAMTRSRGVKIMENARVNLVEEDQVLLEDGTRLASSLSLLLPPASPPPLFSELRAVRKRGQGFLEADRQMRAERPDGRNSLWVIGDGAGLRGLSNGRMAEFQGRVAAWNIARSLGAVGGRPRRYISEFVHVIRSAPGQAVLAWTRPSPEQGQPKRIDLTAQGRWPYFAKMGFEKVWLARHD